MLTTWIGLIIGLAGLYFGGNWLVTGASRIAQSLGIPALIIGLTIVSIGTSMPELLVSISAALSGSSDIAIGNVVGSNIANIGLILGISGLVYPVSVHANLLRREIPIMIGVTLIGYILLRDASVSRFDGILLLAGMVGFIIFMIVSNRNDNNADEAPAETSSSDREPDTVQHGREIARTGLGIIILMVGAQFTVQNATDIARAIGISEVVIGVTLVAVGTSLPELVTSVMAAFKRESDIAIGNVVGSNIFNLLGILGATALVSPITVTSQIIRFDGLIMIAFSLLVIPFVLDRKLGRLESTGFIVAYLVYTVYVVSGAI